MVEVGQPSALDYLLVAAISVIGTLGAIVGWFAKKRIDHYDKHIAEAMADSQELARLDEKVRAHHDEDDRRFAEIKTELQSGRRTIHWVGDCMLTIGAKMDVKLPQRPEKN